MISFIKGLFKRQESRLKSIPVTSHSKYSSGKPEFSRKVLEDFGQIPKEERDPAAVEKASFATDPTQEQPAPGVSQHDLRNLLALYAASEWTHAAIERKQAAVASIRRVFKKKNENGEWVRAKPGETHLENLLNRPNKVQIWSDFVELTITDRSLVGWAVWEKAFEDDDVTKKVVGLKRLRPDRVRIDPDEVEYWKGIEFEQTPGNWTQIPSEKIFMIRNWSPYADYWPVSGAMASQSSAIWEFFGKAWNTSFFRNGAAGMPEGVFETEHSLDEAQIDRIKSSIEDRIGHPDVWRSILILHSGLKYNKTASTPKDVQFAELMERARDAMLATQGVPPAMVGVAVSGAGNFQEQKSYFYQLTVVSEAKRIEESINLWLAPEGERMEFDWLDVLSLVEDISARASAADSEVNRGISTINEIRAERGQSPVPWGDTWNMPLGLAPWTAPGRPERPPGLQDPQSERVTPNTADPSFSGDQPDLEIELKAELQEYVMRRDMLKATVNARTRMERRLAGRYRVAFDRIKAEIMRRFRDNIVSEKKVLKQEGQPQFDIRSLAGIPIQEDEFIDILAAEMGDEILAQTNVAARAAARGLGVDFSEIIDTDPTFAKVFESWRRDRISSTANTITNRVQMVAERARMDGLSPSKALDRMSNEFDRMVSERIADLVPSDATTFSNTAIVAEGRDAFTHKEWVITGANTRDGTYGENHVIMGSQIKAIDEPFEVPGRFGIELMDAPGDPSAGPWNTSRCQCSLNLLTAEEARARGVE